MKVIVPLAGPEGDVEKEFKEFKNFIEVYNKPLIKYIADSRPYSFKNAAFILLKETNAKYKIESRLKQLFGSGIDVFTLESLTEGAPCSVAAYLEKLNTSEDILIDLADQYLSLDKDFMLFIERNRAKVKGIIPVFKSRYWKWSYVSLDSQGFVAQVQEKVDPPISDNATAGVYYFSSSSDFNLATKGMVNANKRVKFNNKFFISCVYNEFPRQSVVTFPVKIICPLGSVEGIRLFPQIAC